MINLAHWKYLVVEVLGDDINTKKPYDAYFTIMSMGALLLDKVIVDTLYVVTQYANVPYENIGEFIKMKNEYLYLLMDLTSSKKNYAGVYVLREGVQIYPPRLDMKGIQIKKSTLNKDVSKKFVEILQNDILSINTTEELLTQKNIDIISILKKLEGIENDVAASLEKGEKTYLKPMSVKDASAYVDPFSEMGIRATIAWNALSDTNKIKLPEKFLVLKCTLTSLADLLELAAINEDAYIRLKEKIFNGPAQLADKGVDVVAIPRTEKSIPEYLIPFIDIDTIIEDNFGNILQILNSIGLETIRRDAKSKFFSNCVEF